MIAVFGSLNMDFVVRVERLPTVGETVLGSGFVTLPGGKGANQAYAAARLGAAVRMIGAVGKDVLGTRLKQSLASVGVDISLVKESAEPTGVALISVDSKGQNTIVVSPGANGTVPAPDASAFTGGVRVALFQLEIPLPVVHTALEMAKLQGLVTMLDPAPAQLLSRELLALVDILTPNETEALALLRKSEKTLDLSQAESIAGELGVPTVILKLGKQGCYVYRDGKGRHVPGFAVEAIDTTAAGDTFNAALACALAEEQPFELAVRFANAAAAIAVTRAGAQTSAPARGEVEALLASSS